MLNAISRDGEGKVVFLSYRGSIRSKWCGQRAMDVGYFVLVHKNLHPLEWRKFFSKILFAKYFSRDLMENRDRIFRIRRYFFLLGRYFVLYVYLLEDKFPYLHDIGES